LILYLQRHLCLLLPLGLLVQLLLLLLHRLRVFLPPPSPADVRATHLEATVSLMIESALLVALTPSELPLTLSLRELRLVREDRGRLMRLRL